MSYSFALSNFITNSNPLQDPKTSRWLWNIRERARQKRRTENYRKIIAMQRDKDLQPTEDGESGQQIAALEKLTRLRDPTQMENFLTYGKWDLKDADIEKLNKEEERKERVCLTILLIYSSQEM